MILAWLLLLTGLTISAVAIYYSVVGLTAIFSAAAIPIIIMGSALEVGKLVCASWLKANWERAPRFMKYYMITAVMVLMLITSMGIFGFLSKAHNDQNLVSGDVQSKIAIYDEKIKTARENIEANRKQLKQMDEAVDQVMGRSTDEKGADKANSIRKSQQRDRQSLAKDIEANQRIIATLNEEAAPIRAEIRKVEAEVGPIKYIAKFIYGERGADENMLEHAVTWIIILIVIVFDPLAVIMLLAAQMTFGWMRKQEPVEVAKEEIKELATDEPISEKTHTEEVPSETPSTALGGDITAPEEPVVPHTTESELDKWNKMIEEAEREVAKEKEEVIERVAEQYHPTEDQFTEVTGDRVKPDLTEVIEPESDESKKKTYMTKDQTGQVQIKNREV
jgi:Tfp pilus assembly protein PilO